MGQLAAQAQNRQLQTMNPQQNMRHLLEKSWPRIMAVIGNNLSPQRLYQMYVSTINREPQLASCSVESVLSCFMKCAALGLEPSNVDGLGRAYILLREQEHAHRQKEATLIIGYKGMIDLARRSGQIRDISARAVHEGDDFSYNYGLNEDLRHVPCAKPGRLTHVYMIANFKDGGHYFQVMNADEIEAAAKRSPSYGKSVSPWKSDYEAMAKKTVIRRAFPFLPVSVEARDAASSDERTPDYSDVFNPLPDATVDEAPVEVGVDEEVEESERQPEAQPETSPVETKRAEMIRRFQALGVASDGEACETISKILERTVVKTSDLSEAELDKVLGQLKASVKEGE
ncbi:DNA binding, phage related protein [Bifidobacterium saguini DSM 23967]|uniref:DNA binding, phage related protein n=1 Tax=Bifidobacterium saguini DSM 23967 TaxID=1437607 RepID=A0A087DAB6_9BIFI|nr:recombinase RecT [Bifidobacterium saguini]KFI92466.1 DNA binding, phage related protein [Bifidobacterium saguini DSM 23967]